MPKYRDGNADMSATESGDLLVDVLKPPDGDRPQFAKLVLPLDCTGTALRLPHHFIVCYRLDATNEILPRSECDSVPL
jgi:hypothetical protein